MSAMAAGQDRKTEELWVRVLWLAPDHVEPDVPLDDEGVPAIPVRGDMPLEERPGHTPGPLVQVCRIWVTPEDAEALREAHKEVEPSDADRAMTLACQEAVAVRDPADPRYAAGEHAKAIFRKIASSMRGTQAVARSAMKEALLVAVSRGLRHRDASDITTEHELSASPEN